MNTDISQTSPKTAFIVIDGGPCSGKTTGLARIKQALEGVGIIALVMPEAATLLIKAGVTPWDLDSLEFQGHVTDVQISLESTFNKAAEELARKHGKKCVVVCDRGLVGQAAYLPGPSPLALLDDLFAERGTSVESARARYAGVIHMVTAADGAESFYTLANNEARTETPEQARVVDKRTLAAWLGHPHVAVAANVDQQGRPVSFDAKIATVVAEVFRILGYPQPIEIEDKFLLERFDPTALTVPYEAISLEQTYLVPKEKGSEERVRARRWLGSGSYYHTVKRPSPDGGRVEIERLITVSEYRRLLERADASRQPIVKTRYCFVWNNQYFEADAFHGRHEGLFLLEREKTDINDSTDLPPFLRVIRDVTDDPAFKNSALAKAA